MPCSVSPFLILALIGFLLNCQPSEPFLTPYMEGTRQVNHDAILQQIYPWNTWSSLLLVLPVGICAQIFGSKSVILLGLLARQATRVLLLFGYGVGPMAVAQITYGLAIAVNQAVWYSFIYSIVRSSNYERGTAWVRGGYSFGNVVGCIIGQSMVSLWKESLVNLFWISWFFCSAGCVLAVVYLPTATVNDDDSYDVVRGASSLRGMREEEVENHPPILLSVPRSLPPSHSLYEVVHYKGLLVLKQHMKKLLNSKVVIVWCVTWWLAQCTNVLITNYYTASYMERSSVCHPNSDGHGTSGGTSDLDTPSSSSSISSTNSFGLLEGMNQVAATLAVGLPLLRHRSSPSIAAPIEISSGTPSSFSSFRRAVCMSTTLLMLSSGFLLLSSMDTCDGFNGNGKEKWQISIALSYTSFIAYTGLYSALMAWSSIELSRASTDMNGGISGRQSLLFGANVFMALLLASVVQMIVVIKGLSAQAVLLCCVVVLAVGGLALCLMFVVIALCRCKLCFASADIPDSINTMPSQLQSPLLVEEESLVR